MKTKQQGDNPGCCQTYKLTPSQKKIAEPVLDDKYKCGDMVEHPAHYNQVGVECWDMYTELLKNKKMPVELAPLWSNVFKYVWRCGDKDGKMVEDMQKAMEYAAKFIVEAGGTIPSFSHIKPFRGE